MADKAVVAEPPKRQSVDNLSKLDWLPSLRPWLSCGVVLTTVWRKEPMRASCWGRLDGCAAKRTRLAKSAYPASATQVWPGLRAIGSPDLSVKCSGADALARFH